MFKKIIRFVLLTMMIICLRPTIVSADAPSLTITTTDPSSPFTFNTSTINDNTTIDGLTINYDNSNNRFVVTISDGKTVNLKQYFSDDPTIDCNTNLLINGNGSLVVTKTPNIIPSGNEYYSYAIYSAGILQVGDNNTSPTVTANIEYDYSANADTISYSTIYARQIKIINSAYNAYNNGSVFDVDGPIDDDALYIDNSKVYIEHYCKDNSDAENTVFEILNEQEPGSYTDASIINGSEFRIKSNYEEVGIMSGALFDFNESGIFVDNSIVDVSINCAYLGLIASYRESIHGTGTEKAGKTIFNNSKVSIINTATSNSYGDEGMYLIDSSNEIAFIDSVFNIRAYGKAFATNKLTITNSSEEYGGIVQNNIESLYKYLFIGFKDQITTGHNMDGFMDGPSPFPIMNVDYPKNNQILTSKKVSGVLNPTALTNDTTLNGDINEYRFDLTTSNEEDLFVNYFEITRKYRVSLNLDGGNCSISKILVNKGGAIGALPTPTKDGYKFIKWVDESGNTINDVTLITDDMTIKAIFESNGGNNNSSGSDSYHHIVLNTGVE